MGHVTPAGYGRAGGLLTALGAGVAIGLALASPASADDSTRGDGGPRSAASESPAGHAPSGDAHRRGSEAATRSRRAANGSSVSATRIVRSAAAVQDVDRSAGDSEVDRSAVPSRPVTARPAITAPAAATPVVTPPPAAATSVAAPALSSAPQSLGSLLFDPRGRRITVFKGVHFVIPQSPAFFVRKVSGTGTFTADSAYDLKDADQFDWNKFSGIVFSPLQHDRNSAMVGWRYNLTTQEFEIAPFYNVDKERILPNEQTEVISVPADGTFQYTVDYDGVTISYGDTTVFKPYPLGLTPRIWTSSSVSGWFGGNEAAPRTLTYYRGPK